MAPCAGCYDHRSHTAAGTDQALGAVETVFADRAAAATRRRPRAFLEALGCIWLLSDVIDGK